MVDKAYKLTEENHRGRVLLPANCRDLTGLRFGKWVVQAFAEKKGSHRLWLYRCDCGTEKPVFENALRGKYSRQCGSCSWRNRSRSKGDVKSYMAWRRLQTLGLLPEEWHDYAAFREALGDPPKRNARLRRRNAAMPHGPGNTYWGIVPSLSFSQRLRRNPKIADIARQQLLKSIHGARTRDELIREIVAARLKGHTYQSIGVVAGMSRQSVFQLIRRYGGRHNQQL